jgi:hypothetical protein
VQGACELGAVPRGEQATAFARDGGQGAEAVGDQLQDLGAAVAGELQQTRRENGLGAGARRHEGKRPAVAGGQRDDGGAEHGGHDCGLLPAGADALLDARAGHRRAWRPWSSAPPTTPVWA